MEKLRLQRPAGDDVVQAPAESRALDLANHSPVKPSLEYFWQGRSYLFYGQPLQCLMFSH